ncbi:hypothetical protein G9A89_018830 [Geosiphon pyriformis]|nr:hypothetical protein G9A89_018830 [Geosiphon pyriformis]
MKPLLVVSVKSFCPVNSKENIKKDIASRKKRKDGVLKNGAISKLVLSEKTVGGFWKSEAGNTTESNSVDMEEKCLIKKTSVNYGERSLFMEDNSNQTPKGLRLITKKALDKPLERINFLDNVDNDNILSNTSVVLPLFLKNLVNVSVWKFFVMNIELDKMVGKSSQEKLVMVKKLFLKVNGFKRAFTPSKFSKIICASFIFKSSLAQTTEKTRAANILVNTNLKRLSSCSDWAVIVKEIPVETLAKAVHAALSKFGMIKSIKMQLVGLDHHRTLLYILPIGTNAYDIWDFIRSVNEKTCIINHHLVIYAWVKCAVVCFNSAELLNTTMETTPVLRGTNLHWSNLISARCAKCEKSDHILLSYTGDKKVSSGSLLHKMLSDTDKNRLAAIYAKQSASVAYPIVSLNIGSSSGIKPSLLVAIEINDRFATLECSFTSLAEHVNMLAKRLEASEPMVFQLSSKCQPLVNSLSQNQEVNIVMSESSSVVTGGKTVAEAVIFNSSVIEKMEDTLNNLAIMVISLLAKMDNAGLVLIAFFSQ